VLDINKHKLRICYIYQDQYPWEVRVEKITNALAEHKMDVHIISRNRDGLPRMENLGDNIFIHRLSNIDNKFIRDILNFPAFFSPIWIIKIIKIINKYSINLIIVRDLPLSPAAYIAAKLTKIPVLIDMAENYPALLKSTWQYRGPKLGDFIIRNPYFLKWMERIIIILMDGIIVVSQQSAKRVEKIVNRRKRTWIVGNTPIINGENDCSSIGDLAKTLRERSTFILLYTGMIEAHRGIDIPIKTLPYLINIIPDILLVIVGKGTYVKKLKRIVKELGVDKNVFFTGWIPNQQIKSIIKVSDVCLIPHYVTEHIDTTLPNKIFDYMSQKKPVVATHSIALMEIVKTTNCGLIYIDKSQESFRDAICKLLNKKYRRKLGFNGWLAIQNRFNWNYDKKILLDAIYKTAKKNNNFKV